MVEAVNSARWLSLAVWVVWLVVYWRGGVDLVAGLRRSLRPRSSARDGLLIVGLILFSNVMLWTGYAVVRGRVADRLLLLPRAFAIAGGALVVIGAAGTIHARRQLGGLWSARTVLLANHRLVDSGAYHVVRHPIYGFACLMSLGTVLVFPTWWTVAAGMLTVILYVVKGLAEERLLVEKLPGYREYQQRVRYRIAPWVW